MNLLFLSVVAYFGINNAYPVGEEDLIRNVTFKNTRRIIGGRDVGETRPYMVYLRPAMSADPQLLDGNWLCGGVIIHERYILTSAACIEDAKQFYVVSGTHRWLEPSVTNDCINYGAKKAIWKCVAKSYVFDGNEFDNIKWMVKDIAVVKVEDDFNFNRRVRGCDFIPKKIAFNNISQDNEKPGTVGSIAGWGSMDSFGDVIVQSTVNSPALLEADVTIITKRSCKMRWDPRYHHIIDSEMICAKDAFDASAMSELCLEQEVNCKELVFSEERTNGQPTRRLIADPQSMQIHTSAHSAHNSTRRTKFVSGGFCENDHGGPLVIGQGKSAVVIGIISACLTKDFTRKCYGPFLYTSVWNNRHLINCAIDKEIGATCRRLLRSSNTQLIETTLNWARSAPNVPQSANHTQSATTKKPQSQTTKRGFPFRSG